MNIAIAQLNYHIGNFEGNFEKMLAAIQTAKSQGADIILFGELATCGYPPRDFLEFNDFISRSDEIISKLCQYSFDIAIVVGTPLRNPQKEGKDLFNAAHFLFEGKIQYTARKTLLPTYDIFDEYRYFEPNTQFDIFEFQSKKIAITICEDIWNLGNTNPLYTTCPLDEVRHLQPEIILNLSASPFDYVQAYDRKHTIRANVLSYHIPMFYSNHVGAQTDIVFDGGSVVMSPDGSVFDEMPYWEECVRTYNVEEVIQGGVSKIQAYDKIELIYNALVTGIREYFRKMKFSKAILGLSGGIDSALTATLAVHALGKENVMGLLMPSQFSSSGSVDDAKELADNLGISYEIIPIKDVYETYLHTLSPFFKDLPFNVTEENLQARIRGMLLMAFSNKFGYILLNTSNKSELAVGYGTLYGDLCGGLAILGDVYKTQVYQIVQYINRDAQIIPKNSIHKPPSAELRPNQKDSDSLPEYDILDKILYQYIEERKGPSEIIAMGFDAAVVNRALSLVNKNEFKREQTAPVIRISPKAFGMGRRMPIEAKYLS